MGKPWMFCDAEILTSLSDSPTVVFYYKLEHQPGNLENNPSAEWLVDFASEDKPYEIWPGNHAWADAWKWAIGREAEPQLNAFLKEKKFMTADDANDILCDVIKKYYPNMSFIIPDEYMAYVDLKNAESGWILKGE